MNVVGRVDVGGDAVMVEEERELGRKSVFALDMVDNPVHLVKIGHKIWLIIFDHHGRARLPALETAGFDEGNL